MNSARIYVLIKMVYVEVYDKLKLNKNKCFLSSVLHDDE